MVPPVHCDLFSKIVTNTEPSTLSLHDALPILTVEAPVKLAVPPEMVSALLAVIPEFRFTVPLEVASVTKLGVMQRFTVAPLTLVVPAPVRVEGEFTL